VEDCIDKIGSAEFVAKFDLLKGYLQVPLTTWAKGNNLGFFQYRVMLFGLENAPATFQRMIYQVLAGLVGCDGYIDDIIIFSGTSEQHIQQIIQFLMHLRQAKLTINLTKSDFGKECVMYLGHVVGKGGIKPIQANFKVITNFPTPTSKNQLLRFLEMVGFYHNFCKNFAVVTKPLTRLLQKRHGFSWHDDQQKAFSKARCCSLCL